MLWDHHTTGVAELETRDQEKNRQPAEPATVTLIAGFDSREGALAARSMVQRRAETLGHGGEPLTVDVETVDPDAWVDPERRGAVTVADQLVDFDVGPAFGHGGHPTTQLAIDGLVQRAAERPLGRVLDVGAGTGVLALGAAILGATTVVAVENDPSAEAVARRNVAAATTTAEVTVVPSLDHPDAAGPFDVVVSNVLLVVHREIGRSISDRVASGGALIVSGAVEEQADELCEVYASAGPPQHTFTNDGWVGLSFAPAAERR